MRTSVLELLNARDIIHPTRIDRATLDGTRLTVLASGHPWWLPESARSDDGSIEFMFEDISWGRLDLTLCGDDHDEDLETFSVQSLENIDWAQPAIHQIFCSAPTPDPLALFVKLEDYLSNLEAFLRAGDFLNHADFSLGLFAETVSSNSYLVGRGPNSVRELLCEELDRQHVPYNVFTQHLPPDRRMWVQLGDADFLCLRAIAQFEPS